MENLMIKCITVFVAFVITVVSKYVLDYLKLLLTDNEMEMLKRFIKAAVMCANQIYSPEEWRTKKRYVLNEVENFLNERIKIQLTAEQIDMLIEGIVNEVKNENK